MQTELIKLKVRKQSARVGNTLIIKIAFIKACETLNASIFEPYIQDDIYFENLDKYRFLQSMKEQFDYLRSEGIKEVKLVIGKCEMCFVGEKVHEFYVNPNAGKPAFAYNIQEKQGVLKDIFRCNYSNGYERDVQKNLDPNITFVKQ